MKIVHPDKWLPCDGISLEEAADTAVRCSDRHVLVVAGPGAGKTELLAQKAAFLFQTNQCRASKDTCYQFQDGCCTEFERTRGKAMWHRYKR